MSPQDREAAPPELTEMELGGLKQNLEAAHDELAALCAGEYRTTFSGKRGKRFRMTIPVDDEDSDVVLARGLSAGDALLGETARLRARLAELETLLREGREFALANTRAAAVRHTLYAWGDRVDAAL